MHFETLEIIHKQLNLKEKRLRINDFMDKNRHMFKM